MNTGDAEIFEMHAEFCRMIASSKRLMIIELLARKEMSVSKIAQALGLHQSNISQHLRVLKSQHIVEPRKEGQTVYYQLTNIRLAKVCSDIRSILLEGMEQRGKKAKGLIKSRT
nr:winged helix-turn-helix transcriptional regulator [candidate division Zixibacteria bacterium]